MYWYDKYSSISVKLNVSSTSCKSVHINDCPYDHVCNCVKFAAFCENKNKEESRCNDYLNKISDQLNTKVAYQHKESDPGRMEHGRLMLSLNTSECIVFQIFRTEDQVRGNIYSSGQYFDAARNLKLMPELGLNMV